MKLSTESIVAAAVAVAFVFLGVGVIVQEQGERGTASIDNPPLSHMVARGPDQSSVLELY
jgi:hypothetical protein